MTCKHRYIGACPEGCDMDVNEWPEQCNDCGSYQKDGEEGAVIQVLDDDGDPENGPTLNPEIINVWICDKCLKERTK